ncbi:hypothetical protein [Clostridium uliginosum]|uniref:NHL repeat-containing protein n=1 Tax=Clostridium uliginosum TaxID=119641 RepID=A0A1I1QWR5_9CLOT|nr:hypothetical protein [Clostridium uliginosum]SFD26442.1 hypothetical protein SAMN05421842_12812 [Clostridium uliginosum]
MKKVKYYKSIIYIFLVLIQMFSMLACSVASDTITSKISFPRNSSGNLTYLNIDKNFESEEIDETFSAGITFYSENEAFLVDYASLKSINIKDNSFINIVPPENFDVKSEKYENKIWNPTGIYFNKNTNLLYIANYNGHNILVCKVNENHKLELVKEITNDQMISPENVVTNSDGTKIAVADYDGNALFLFDNNGQMIWKREVPLAHGVTLDENYVYATSLEKKSVVKYDFSGNEIIEKGSIGQTGIAKYMWPTSIFAYENNIVLTDAHSGRIIILDKNLNYVSSIGGNGPSINDLNFPYSTVVHQNYMYVTDTFNSRVLKLDMSGNLIKQWSHKSFSKNEENKTLLLHPYKDIPYTYGEMNDIPSELFNPLVTGKTVVSSYASIDLYNNDSSLYKKVYLSDYECNKSDNYAVPFLSQIYITWCKKYQYDGKTFFIFGSPQRTGYYYIFDLSDGIFFVNCLNSADIIWRLEDKFYSNNDVDNMMKTVLSASKDSINKFNQYCNDGMDRRNAYIKSFCEYYNIIFGTHLSENEFGKWIDKSFITEYAKEFLANYSTSNTNKNITEKYFENSNSSNSIMYLSEIMFIKTFGYNGVLKKELSLKTIESTE